MVHISDIYVCLFSLFQIDGRVTLHRKTNIFPLILQLPCQPVDNNDYNNDNDDYVDNKKYPLVSPLPIELRGSLPILS